MASVTDLDVSERLPVEDEVLTLSDRIVHVKVLLTEQVLVEVELLQISAGRTKRARAVSNRSSNGLWWVGWWTNEMRPPREESTSGWSMADWIAAGYL